MRTLAYAVVIIVGGWFIWNNLVPAKMKCYLQEDTELCIQFANIDEVFGS